MAVLPPGEEMEMDAAVESPENGVLVHGLYMDGFRWDMEEMVVVDSLKGEMNPPMPILHMEPVMDYVIDDKDYNSPLYKTGLRAGTLSTTGKTY